MRNYNDIFAEMGRLNAMADNIGRRLSNSERSYASEARIESIRSKNLDDRLDSLLKDLYK